MEDLRLLILRDVAKTCRVLFGVEPTYYQREFVEKVLMREGKGKYILVASTRAGKTTTTSMLAVLLAIVYSNEDVVIVAPTMRQSNILFGMVRNYFFTNPLLFQIVDRKKGFTREIIHLINGSTIRMLTAGSPEGLLGFGASTLIIDETASIEDTVVRTRLLRMLASPRNRQKPLLVLLGTPHRAGFFYEAWLSEDFMKFRWTWRDAVKAGIMNPEVVEYFRKTLSRQEFMRWFEAEFIPEEEGMFFNPLEIRDCAVEAISSKPEPPRIRLNYKIYCGLDIARYGDDETALVCLKVPDKFLERGEAITVAGYWRWGKASIAETIGRVSNIINEWNPDMVAVDTVGIGAGVYDLLAERFGPIVVSAFELAKRDDVFVFLKRLIEERKIILPKDEYFMAQFSSYKVRYDSWGRPRIQKTQGKRDDLVDALVYAIYCAYAYETQSRVEFVPIDIDRIGQIMG